MQELGNLIKVIGDNGLSIICVLYMIYFQLVVMQKYIVTQNEILKTLVTISNRLDKIEQEVVRNEKSIN